MFEKEKMLISNAMEVNKEPSKGIIKDITDTITDIAVFAGIPLTAWLIKGIMIAITGSVALSIYNQSKIKGVIFFIIIGLAARTFLGWKATTAIKEKQREEEK